MAEICRMDAGFDPRLLEGSSCAFGVFDGVHTGHRYLIGQACESARAGGAHAVVLTFDIDPDELFHAERLKKLLGNEERLEMLARTGVDAVCVLPFTRAFASAGPQDFLSCTFGSQLPFHLHVGQDIRFGAKAQGTIDDLRRWGCQVGTQIHAHSLVLADGAPITATRIRLLLLDGKVEQANKLLGYPYTVTDTVVFGRGEGAQLGFATANMQLAGNKRVLAEGVYAAYALVDGMRYRAAVAVGVSPMFEASSTANMEVHILDFEGDLYGKRVAVQFVHRIRHMIEFATSEELVATVLDNIEWVRKNLSLEE